MEAVFNSAQDFYSNSFATTLAMLWKLQQEKATEAQDLSFITSGHTHFDLHLLWFKEENRYNHLNLMQIPIEAEISGMKVFI